MLDDNCIGFFTLTWQTSQLARQPASLPLDASKRWLGFPLVYLTLNATVGQRAVLGQAVGETSTLARSKFSIARRRPVYRVSVVSESQNWFESALKCQLWPKTPFLSVGVLVGDLRFSGRGVFASLSSRIWQARVFSNIGCDRTPNATVLLTQRFGRKQRL